MIDKLALAKAIRSTPVTMLLLLLAGSDVARAHEGHPTIPTTGAAVSGDELLLSKGARAALGVTTAKVTLADMPTSVRANGRITVPWRQHAYVTTLMSGVVEEVLVHPGAELQERQVLARISSLELENLQLDMLRADSDYTYFRALYEQRQQLSEKGSISGRKLMETTQAREEAAARLQVAITKLKTLGIDSGTLQQIRSTGQTVRQVEIRSPIRGTLVHADIRAGQSVDREEHLFHVVDNSVVWCVADVLETDSASVEVGQPVTVDLAALGTTTRQGRVDHIDISVDPQKRAVQMVTELDNNDLTLRPGMSARIAIQVAESDQAIICPRESLLRFGEDAYVLLKRGEGKFVRRKLELGRIGRQNVEVLNGVFPGDRVVSTGAHLLGSLFQGPAARETHGDARKGSPQMATASDNARDCRQILTATGVVEVPTTGKFFATSRITGRITDIFVEHSQRVEEGDRLAELESMELFDLQLELFQRNLEQRWIERTLQRLEPVAQTGGVSKLQTRQLKNELQKLEQQVATLRRRLTICGLDEQQISRLLDADAAQTDLSDLVAKSITIRAPHAGLVAHFDLAPGMTVNAHDHRLFEIHDPSQVWIKAYLFEDQAGAIATGQEAEVRFAADPLLRASGHVVRISPTSTESRRVFPVWIELDDPPESLGEGMLTSVFIQAPRTPPLAMRARPESVSPLAGEGE